MSEQTKYHIEISFRDSSKENITILARNYEIEANVLRIENLHGEFTYYPLDTIAKYSTSALDDTPPFLDVHDVTPIAHASSHSNGIWYLLRRLFKK